MSAGAGSLSLTSLLILGSAAICWGASVVNNFERTKEAIMSMQVMQVDAETYF